MRDEKQRIDSFAYIFVLIALLSSFAIRLIVAG